MIKTIRNWWLGIPTAEQVQKNIDRFNNRWVVNNTLHYSIIQKVGGRSTTGKRFL